MSGDGLAFHELRKVTNIRWGNRAKDAERGEQSPEGESKALRGILVEEVGAVAFAPPLLAFRKALFQSQFLSLAIKCGLIDAKCFRGLRKI